MEFAKYKEKIEVASQYLNSEVRISLESGIELKFVPVNSFCFLRATALVQSPNENQFSEPETLSWIDQFPEYSKFFDIGANVGSFSLYAAISRKAQVSSFEPSSQNFWVLIRNIYLNNQAENITAFPIAISNYTSLDRLFLSSLDIGASGNSAGKDINWKLERRVSKFAQRTFVTSIDRLIEDNIVDAPDYIKIDVDGIEHDIIDGCSIILKSRVVKGILVELTDKLAAHQRVINTMKGLGYRYSIEETEKNRTKDVRWEGMCNYIFYT